MPARTGTGFGSSFPRSRPLGRPKAPSHIRQPKVPGTTKKPKQPLELPGDPQKALEARWQAWQGSKAAAGKGTASILEFICWEWLTKVKRLRQDVDFCSVPGQRVLTTDLLWRPVETLVPGDKLLAPAEMGTYRPWVESEVVYNTPRVLPVFRVRLSTGAEITVTGEHPWLSTHTANGNSQEFGWIKTDQLKPGWQVPQLLPVWEPTQTWEAGWLAGMFDGEGSLVRTQKSWGGSHNLCIAQNPGPTRDRIIGLLAKFDFPITVPNGTSLQIRINGGRAEMLRLLGQIRPDRLRAKLSIPNLGMVNSWKRKVFVESVTSLGNQQVCGLETTSHTYLLEGFGAHNSYQSPMFGGRTRAGGTVVDFYFPDRQLAWNPAGLQFHFTAPSDRAHDALIKAAMAGRGITLIYLYEDDLMQRPEYTMEHALRGEAVGWRNQL